LDPELTPGLDLENLDDQEKSDWQEKSNWQEKSDGQENAQRRVQNRIAGWQSALIDLTRRNPLYALPSNARGLLSLPEPTPDELYLWLVRRRKPLQFDLARTDLAKTESDLFSTPRPKKAGHLIVAEAEFKTLNTLRLRSALALREQGINILFVAMGMLEWVDPSTRDAVRSPLLLVPVALERLPGGDALRLTRFEDEIEVNPTLRFRLSQADLQINLPELPDEEDLTPSAYFAAAEALLPQRSGWKLTPEMVLGRFSFLKMTMYRDLVAQSDRARNHPVIAALAGDRSALTRLPAISLPSVQALDDVTRGEQAYQVLDADPTQQRAILAARRGQSFVLQGPPGTGKTQTIANVITECIAAGKRVLFVSQKMAALDAVFKRLRDKGLADLCLEAHSHKANKKDVLEQLRRSLNARQHPVQANTLQPDVIDAVRDALTDVVEALHTPRLPLGLSLYDANGIVAAAADVPDLPFVFIVPEKVTAERYRQFEALAERLAGYHSLFAEVGSHPWRGIRATRFTLDLQTTVRTVFSDLFHQFELLEAEVQALAGLCQLPSPRSLPVTDHLVQVADAAAKSPRPPRNWFTPDPLTPDGLTLDLHEASDPQNENSFATLRQTASQCQAQYRAYLTAKAVLLGAWSADLLVLPHAQLLDQLGPRSEPLLLPAFGPGWADSLAHSFPEIDTALQQVVEKTERLQRGLAGLVRLSGRAPVLTPSAARHEAKIAELAGQDPRPQPSWFSLEGLPEHVRRAEEAAAIHQKYVLERTTLLNDYTERVLGLDLSLLQARFASDYDSLLKYFKPAFYRDCKTVLMTLRPESPRRGRDLQADITLAEEVRSGSQWIQAHTEGLRAAFGSHYQGLETQWAALTAALRQTGLVLEACSGQVPPALMHRLIGSGLELEALRDQLQPVQSQLQGWDDAVKALGRWMDLTQLPFTDLPLSQSPFSDLLTWLRQVRVAAAAYESARQEALACRIPVGSQLANFVTPDALSVELTEAQRLVTEEAAIRAESTALEARYQGLFRGLDTDWSNVLAALDWAEHFRRLYPESSVPEGLLRVVTEASSPLLTDIAGAQKMLVHRLEALRLLLDKLSDLFPPERLYVQSSASLGQILPLTDAPFAAVSSWLQVRLNRLSDLERWIDFQNLREACSEAGLLSFFETTTHRQPEQNQILPAFRKQFHRLWLDGVTDTVPAVRQFRGEDHSRLIERFCALDARQIELAPEGVRTLALGHKLNIVSSLGEMGALKTQLSRQRPKAIRKLLADIPNLLFLLKPCLLMSPLSVSLFLESETIWFDTVIFDEASQVFTEDAVGAILRAKQVIIAGDAQQLPPTSFFQGLGEDGGEEYEEEGDGAGDGDFESVLKAADAFADPESPYFAEHPLNWHYRSHHESLIAFSKVHFYKNLIPYPSSCLASAVTLDRVPGGVYYPGKGARRNNPVEAARVADLVFQHVEEHPEQSVGVITFNEPQQTTILAEIERRKAERPALAPLLSEEGSEGFFVKNIENVQGDERDVIFLSLGFGPDPAGRLSMNFGPLNQDGGERRLNVAVTRARRRMTVVASFGPGQIDLTRTAKRGPALLKAYLEFAERGSQGGGSMLADPPRSQSAFESAVETALRRQGYRVVRQVGLFDYRVDLAIVDADDSNRYLLGIECDGPMYRDAPTVRARERLRPQVLQALEWRLLRLWSMDWVRDPERELAKVAEAVRRIKTGEKLEEGKRGEVPTQRVPASESLPSLETPGQRIAETRGPYDATSFNTASDEDSNGNSTGSAHMIGSDQMPVMDFFQRWAGTLSGGRTAFYSNEEGDDAARMAALLQIVETEGPLPLEAATQRLAEAAGIARAGARVQEIVEETAEALSQREKIDLRANFLWPHGLERPAPRAPRAQEAPRPFEFICLEEIGEAAVSLLKVAYGMRRDELILETARLLGYRSTSTNIRERVSDALSALELDNRIQVVGGQIRALELS
jgi:very-short-patch-repair endonuclease